MRERIVLVGAGSVSFGLETLSEIFATPSLSRYEVVLHDINEKNLSHVLDRAHRHLKGTGTPFVVSATTDRKSALEGAAFVLISIETGDRFYLWDQDRKLPLRYGYDETYGENGGPGGLFHSLRVIPPVLDICTDIATICPGALVLNYTNPMSRVVQAVTRAFPYLRCVGLCHEINSVARYVPELLDVSLEEIEYTAGGLNHFSVVTELRYRADGRDAYPDLRNRADAYFEHAQSAIERMRGLDRATRPRNGRYLFMEILDRYGYLPITEDSHFGEYLPWAAASMDRTAIHLFYEAYKTRTTEPPGDVLEPPPPLDREWAVPIIDSMTTDEPLNVPAVNVRNNGSIPDLPDDLVVEVPARVEGGAIHQQTLSTYPLEIASLLSLQAGPIRMTAEAAITGRRGVALQALLSDPLTRRSDDAERLLDEMIAVQRPYLDYLE